MTAPGFALSAGCRARLNAMARDELNRGNRDMAPPDRRPSPIRTPEQELAISRPEDGPTLTTREPDDRS